MTVYARSDVVHIAIPFESGGCGYGHTRPVIDGAPVKVFAVSCARCESYLLRDAHDPCWSNNPDNIPLTADEKRKADRLAEEGTGTMRQVAEALAINAGRILHEQQQSEVLEAAKHAQVAEAAAAERRAAEAERARAEQDARLREAERVAQSFGAQTAEYATGSPQMVTPGAPRLVEDQRIEKAAPDFPIEVHPSRLCATGGHSLTRKAHSTGRWANYCLDCRENKAA